MRASGQMPRRFFEVASALVGFVVLSSFPSVATAQGARDTFRNLGIEPETARRSVAAQTRLGLRLNQRVETRIENRIGTRPGSRGKERNGLYENAPFPVPDSDR